ncbi:HD domain-containing protein [Bacillus thuringiensis]|uniref:HD domain-containing protein n=1 Tax=Bacillus thuringiensis TaxID=1428 RepID=UPI0026E145AE|nr:hypothetical protein [Bacillus thuringiensis]MDO6628664.1 hypothetical protein [Bacillus thuringiensis]MDO6659211.1 hypothetical protein [Bacillus thuringiensis]MDO6698793.1 hypothetical protein [Bacillus thuringiensis]
MDDILLQVNGQVGEHDLLAITEENVELFNSRHNTSLSYENMKREIESQGLVMDNFYLSKKLFEPYCYYKFPVFYTTPSLKEVLSLEGVVPLKQHLEYLEEYANRILFEEKNYFKFLVSSPTQAKFMLMNKVYWYLSEQERYELFISFYAEEDYGHYLIDKDLIKDAIKNQPTEYRQEMLNRLNKTTGDTDTLTIYRGCSDKSTTPEEAMSWTLSKNTAIFFAMSRGLDGDIYEAKVKKEHVIDYLQGRHEEEILVLPQHVEDIKPYEMIKTNDEINAMLASEHVEEYHLYKNTFIKDEYFDNPEGIHGTRHCKRVLFHALSLAKEFNLNTRDRAILSNAACYHDIGRTNDDEDRDHGLGSVIKHAEEVHDFPYMCINVVDRKNKNKNYELEYMNDEEINIIEFIMQYHCIGDEESREALDRLAWDDEIADRTWKLYQLFKDADGLDRVRIKDLNVDYLRTEAAQKRVLFAYGLLKGIE